MRRSKRRRRRMRCRIRQTLCPAGITLDSGGNLLLGYSDERLCLPSDNCSLRGRERSINQNQLRYCKTPPPTEVLRIVPENPPSPREDPEGLTLKGINLVKVVSLFTDSRPLPGGRQSSVLSIAVILLEKWKGDGGKGSLFRYCQI